MERLTKPAWRNLDPWECCGQDYYCKRGCHDEGGCTGGCIVPKLYVRLAKYEDTGLSPADLKRVRETLVTSQRLKKEQYEMLEKYLKAEAESRLVILPCRINQVVYFISDAQKRFFPSIMKARFEAFSIRRGRHGIKKRIQLSSALDDEGCVIWGGGEFAFESFGKAVFLTREEAEAALKGANNAD